jgi:hypothetical protein
LVVEFVDVVAARLGEGDVKILSLLEMCQEAAEVVELVFQDFVIGVKVGIAPGGEYFGEFKEAGVDSDAVRVSHGLNPFS